MAQTLKPGDMIEVLHGSYEHWALYIGGDEVIHLVPKDQTNESFHSLALLSTTAEVKREKLNDAVGHLQFKVNNLLDDKYEARERHVIVREACAMVGRVLPYSVATYNCEHFVTNLRYGKPESRQVKTVADFAGVAVAGLVAVGLAAALFSSLFSKEEEKEKDYRTKSRRRHQNWQ
ncbi:phospholipase A and acyltransferase 4-like [Paralichthys olivaceus]|uniref:phospholipase A and acyltransferase 4-like n=1 Tax=Paralichthys olivaceus TaxID=8255 RepID=UPI003750180B